MLFIIKLERWPIRNLLPYTWKKKAFKSRQNKIWHYCLKEQPVDTFVFIYFFKKGTVAKLPFHWKIEL